MDVLTRMRSLQKERNWTNKTLAQSSGVAIGTVNNMYKNETMPRTDTLEKYCRGFGITLAEFYNEESDVVYPTEEFTALLRIFDRMGSDAQTSFLHLLDSVKH